ncbi:uncharacterized protein DNG_06452 [Cephalotrichum gorgonifer]|uniref:Transcription factor RfeG n=1 Tax=Cephalotrichum gorgonifer TaxID=2041049 RepID=A0AAE8N1L7_9PEZI|nr:uncharacterized protein DNG_06452 [Cephalotrichum gorgonifer]
MSRRTPAATHPPPMAPPTQAPNARQNEYFIPRDGIDREVITSDICRYLGNDALVRPGTYDDPESGHSISGYYITAYRNLTSAMIDDLKADSARWEQERRAKSSRNASGVQYHSSDTYARRQQGGPSEHNAYGNARDSYDASHPPPHSGPDNSGYAGYAPQPPAGQYMQQNQQGGYPSGNPGAFPPPAGYPGAQKPFPQQDPGYPPSGQQGMAYPQAQDNWLHGAARPMAAPGYRDPNQFSPGGVGPRDHMMTTPPSQGNYHPPPQHPQPGYAPTGGDYYHAQPGAGYQSMPQDPQYGRGGHYQERTTSPPGSKPSDRFATTAKVQPPPADAYGSMQGQQPTGAPAPAPRRQEPPKHQSYKPAGNHR